MAPERRIGQAVNETLDLQVESLLTSGNYLSNYQIAENLGVSTYRLRGSIKRLEAQGGVDNITKAERIDFKVKYVFTNSKEPPTKQQIQEITGISASQLNASLRRLRDEGEICRVIRARPVCAEGMSVSPKLLKKEKLADLLKLTPDRTPTLRELASKLGVSKEYARLLLNELRQDGLDFKKRKECNKQRNDELAKQKAIKENTKLQILSEIRDLLLKGYSGPEIAKMLRDETKGVMSVFAALNVLRKSGEVPRQRKQRRNLAEMSEADNRIKRLYDDGLPYLEIGKLTGCTTTQIEASLRRLENKGVKVVGRRPRKIKA